MNENSLTVFNGKVEPYVFENNDDRPYQFIRTGYYKRIDAHGKPAVGEIVSLKDNFNK